MGHWNGVCFLFSATWAQCVGRAVWMPARTHSGNNFSQALTGWLLGVVAVCEHDKERGVQKSEMVLRCQVEPGGGVRKQQREVNTEWEILPIPDSVEIVKLWFLSNALPWAGPLQEAVPCIYASEVFLLMLSVDWREGKTCACKELGGRVVEVEGWKERLAVVNGEGVVQEHKRNKVLSILPCHVSCNSWTRRWVMLCGDCGLVSRDQTAHPCQPCINGVGKRRILLGWSVPG